MSRFARFLSFALVFALLGGCMPGSSPSVSKKVYQSEKPREASPQVVDADKNALASRKRRFCSGPLPDPGKAGTGEEFLLFALQHLPGPGDDLCRGARRDREPDGGYAALYPAARPAPPDLQRAGPGLAARKDLPGKGSDGKGFRLNIVNDLWGQQDYTFLPAYLDLLAQNYGAGLRGIKANPEASRQAINDYIAQKTEQRIKDLDPFRGHRPADPPGADQRDLFQRRLAAPFEKEPDQRRAFYPPGWFRGAGEDDDAPRARASNMARVTATRWSRCPMKAASSPC